MISLTDQKLIRICQSIIVRILRSTQHETRGTFWKIGERVGHTVPALAQLSPGDSAARRPGHGVSKNVVQQAVLAARDFKLDSNFAVRAGANGGYDEIRYP